MWYTCTHIYNGIYDSVLKRRKSCHLWQNEWTWRALCLVTLARQRKTDLALSHLYVESKKKKKKTLKFIVTESRIVGFQRLGGRRERPILAKKYNLSVIRWKNFGVLMHSIMSSVNSNVDLKFSNKVNLKCPYLFTKKGDSHIN